MISLPEKYQEQMKMILGPEVEDFLASSRESRAYGLRVNSQKIGRESPFREKLSEMFELTPVPWCGDGFYYPGGKRPGKHPYHAAGLYYIQEPSAMSAVGLLHPKPGDLVLDLAAAPGGKATQIAAMLEGRGVLVANEIHPGRAKILSENIERFGISNALVTQMAPDALSGRFAQAFDKIMLDAPCSGEGMFRKDPDAVNEWSPEQVASCALRQQEILPHAVRMLKPGGTMVYSTCTFNRQENETMMEWLLEAHPDMQLLTMKRYWPHLVKGEGHFTTLLRKLPSASADILETPNSGGFHSKRKRTAKKRPAHLSDALQIWEAFRNSTLPDFRPGEGEAMLFGEQLFWISRDLIGLMGDKGLHGIKALRPGLHLGTVRKQRIDPSHALALALPASAYAEAIELGADSPLCEAYLRGETFAAPPDSPKGWSLITADGFALGWGKAAGGQVKNHYPRGLRRI